MSNILLTVKHEGKNFHVTHVSTDGKYVLGSRNKSKLNKKFKLEVDALNLSDKDKAALTKAQLKSQL